MVFWIQEITRNRPLKTLKINEKNIQGLLDTGADSSCIAGKDWPNGWPTRHADNMLVGLGTAPAVAKSTQILNWENTANKQAGSFCPYVIPGLPMSIWGRDILMQMGMLLYSPDDWVSSQMLKMGYDPDKGLGKNQEGRLYPVVTEPKNDKHGVGYPNL
ncbi:endogenous retrovirus group K member 7 Pro protein-like [Orcinus orca]|uniref:endogenous retrovirus group K member 7 Pro protein-like n=1 Tax=Orcinus orca TaxID=9733 RepID=UPI002111AE8B|nr:endogenous retrovirus group K member 7 Pro protein-like [Orcinus orca]